MKTNKTVLISGASRGIGAASVRAFCENGYRVAFLYNQNETLARQIEDELGENVFALKCDVRNRIECEKAVNETKEKFGTVDILVNNAGIAQQKLFTDITEEEWSNMLAVHLTGAFNLCQCVIPDMVSQKSGKILSVSSMWGQVGASCEVHYSTAKAGLIGMTKALAMELAPSNIMVNCVCPGAIETDMMREFSKEDKFALCEEIPLGRLGRAEEVAELLVFLASEKANYCTGQVFGINGGMVV